MTAGRGISHSENSTPGTTTLHGAQLWVALPDAERHASRGSRTTSRRGSAVTVGGAGLPRVAARRHVAGADATPLLGAEILLEPDTRLALEVDPEFEHGVLVDSGVSASGTAEARPADLAYCPPAPTPDARGHDEPCRLLLLGGPPFGESIVMWWNFVGRTHEEIVGYREEWQDQITPAAPWSGTPRT